jgi:hypothetical protein
MKAWGGKRGGAGGKGGGGRAGEPTGCRVCVFPKTSCLRTSSDVTVRGEIDRQQNALDLFGERNQKRRQEREREGERREEEEEKKTFPRGILR